MKIILPLLLVMTVAYAQPGRGQSSSPPMQRSASVLQTENDRLRKEISDLKAENERLRAAVATAQNLPVVPKDVQRIAMGTIIQVMPQGLLVRCGSVPPPWARARALEVAGSEIIPFIENLTVLLVGLKDADKKAEGETVYAIVRENGLFKYTDVRGASRTVKQFDAIPDILPPSSNK
jgi:hypothetical protein